MVSLNGFLYFGFACVTIMRSDFAEMTVFQFIQ